MITAYSSKDVRMSSSRQRSGAESSADLLPRPPRPRYGDLCVPAPRRPSTSKFAPPALALAPAPAPVHGGSCMGRYLRSYPFTREKVSTPKKVMRLLAKLNPFSREQRSSYVKTLRLAENKRKRRKKKEEVEEVEEVTEVPIQGSLLPLPPRLWRYK